MDLLYFVLLTSALIFIHESGHFVAAKTFGVKVITFSIGFGPKILRLRGRETEYCLALLPFGGFVKMLEETKGTDTIVPEDRKRTFESQTLWKRIIIVLAGPAMNVFFPVVLYFSVFLGDRMLLPPTIGVAIPGKPAAGKLMAGDQLVSMDGSPISSWNDIHGHVASHAGRPLHIEVERDGKPVGVDVTPYDDIVANDLEVDEHVGKLGIVAFFPQPVLGIPRIDSPAYRSGLRTFDRITAINGKPIDRFVDLVDRLSQNHGEALVVAYLRPVPVSVAGGLCDVAVMEPGVATLTPMLGDGPPPLDADARAADVLQRTGIESSDMYVAYVPEESSEWKAGLRAGDRITKLDGQDQLYWQSMENQLVRGASEMHELAWTRAGTPMAGRFQLRKEQWEDEYAVHYERFVFRTTNWVPYAPDDLIPNPHRFLYAIERGIEETANVARFIGIGIVRLFEGRVSLETVSGPITMYDVAGQAGAKGTTYFIWAMAVISINLGLVNLLPIPVLDGGHLFFLAIEAIQKRPLSLRARELSSLVGMSLIVLLMLLAFKNDVERRWDVIAAQIHEIFS
ncbi:MAG: RIP metalloprotease RseP [Polyangiaceae bacterium]